MVTKRVAPEKKPTRRKAAAEVPVLTESVAGTGIEMKRSPAVNPPSVDPNVRRQLVAAEAYFLAERRGFRAGGEIEDWVAAEAVVDSRLRQVQVA
jgi:hypothetical protein